MPSQARRLLVGALLGGLAAFLVVDLLVFRDESSSSTPTAASQPEPSAAPTLVPPTPAFGGPVGTTVVEPPSGPGLGAAAGAEDGTQGEPAASGGEAESTGAEPATAGSADGAAAPPPVQEVEISTPRGESWLQVRRGRQAGPILYEGVLAPDKTVTFEAKTLFIRVGAVASVDIHQDGSLVSDGLEGTLDLELTRARGLRVVS